MLAGSVKWEPTSHEQWASALGLVHVPLFPSQSRGNWQQCSALLDGRNDSFSLLSTDDGSYIYEREPLSWSWSSNLLHSVLIDTSNGSLFVRRWDSSNFYRSELPANAEEARTIFQNIERAKGPSSTDVILHALKAFRQVRDVLDEEHALNAIRLFNALLLVTEKILEDENLFTTWDRWKTFNNVIELLNGTEKEISGVSDVPKMALNRKIGNLLSRFIERDYTTEFRMEPGLLIRHAAGQLYQEAHLMIEREQQLYFPGYTKGEKPKGILKGTIRFTPVVLARALAQEAIKESKDHLLTKPKIEILDPACGSGIFLIEMLRELHRHDYSGEITLRGFDIEAISCAMAKFCLGRAEQDIDKHKIRVSYEISEKNALISDWGSPDIILMNPPFLNWQMLNTSEKEDVKNVMADVFTGRVNTAMAFLWKGAKSLSKGSILVSVVPAALLESKSGYKLRKKLEDICDLFLLGHFQGHGLFQSSQVIPAILGIKRPLETSEIPDNVKVLIASEGYEYSVIRALRTYRVIDTQESDEGKWEIFNTSTSSFSPASWLPKEGKYLRLIEKLSKVNTPVIKELFHVRKGVITGNNDAFVISGTELDALPKKERKYFKPAASSKSIKRGHVAKNLYVFYPYSNNGPLLIQEDELRDKLPMFYDNYLLPLKAKLRNRSSINPDLWWLLARDRREYTFKPKIVSKFRGEQGSFAFDCDGEFAVLEGYGWIWKGYGDVDEDAFHDSYLPFAYLAILNSQVFLDLIACYCPRLIGGYYDLSTRFINNVFLPNLAEGNYFAGSQIQKLAAFGNRIHESDDIDNNALNEAVKQIFGLE